MTQNDAYHVMPINDLKEHIAHEGCRCKPLRADDGKVIVHNSWDGREFDEQPSEGLKQYGH